MGLFSGIFLIVTLFVLPENCFVSRSIIAFSLRRGVCSHSCTCNYITGSIPVNSRTHIQTFED